MVGIAANGVPSPWNCQFWQPLIRDDREWGSFGFKQFGSAAPAKNTWRFAE
jgi:hypothetical protein